MKLFGLFIGLEAAKLKFRETDDIKEIKVEVNIAIFLKFRSEKKFKIIFAI